MKWIGFNDLNLLFKFNYVEFEIKPIKNLVNF